MNLTIALTLGAPLPSMGVLAGAAILGFLSYGISLALFVVALRHLGTARTGAYFSVAPFFGAVLAVLLLDEPVTSTLLVAGGLMGLGVWLHIIERHVHTHGHLPLEHEHEHEHDVHHDHHPLGDPAPVRHTHRHRHDPMTHSHEHYPDEHHRHPH